MNKTILALAIIVISLGQGYAQISEGVIQYEYRLDVHRSIPPEREDMKAMIPQYRTENYVLLFRNDERLYRPNVDVNEVATRGGGGPRMMMRTPRMDVYINTSNQEWVTAQEFMGRNYLIVDSLNIAPWRLGSEYMDIAGYRCQMAWYTDTVTNEEITAWFTLAIQPFMGPDRFSSLPGTILALDINNGERVWVARKIENRALGRDEEIRKPNRGERISREEYRKMVDEQMQRMRSGPGFRF
jgi:GLPGLI family protein